MIYTKIHGALKAIYVEDGYIFLENKYHDFIEVTKEDLFDLACDVLDQHKRQQ